MSRTSIKPTFKILKRMKKRKHALAYEVSKVNLPSCNNVFCRTILGEKIVLIY